MITLYSGTPGSGKSYHACLFLLDWLKHKDRGLIANFPVDLGGRSFPEGNRLVYWDNSEITPSALVAYARTYHKAGIEGQTLLIVDEAQVLWNARTFQSGQRMAWIKFFSQHRKLGYNILMIAQNDRMIDKQLRMLIEIEVKHRKLNNYGLGGFLFTLGNMRTCFVAIKYWYGGNKLLLDKQTIWYKKSVADIYDTMRMFDDADLAADYGSLALLDGGKDVQVLGKKRRFSLICPPSKAQPPPAFPSDPGGVETEVEPAGTAGGPVVNPNL